MLAQKLNGLGSRKLKVERQVGFVAGEALLSPRYRGKYISVPDRDGQLA